jgi:dTDP-4-amino-4,6-dideoxygalactose transaminase
MSNLLAAVGRGQLVDLDAKLEQRRRINQRYRAALGDEPGLTFMPASPHGEPNHWLTVLLVEPDEFGADRTAISEHLDSLDIESRPAWKPMHLQPLYRDHPHHGGAVAEHIFETGLCLPSGTTISESDQERVIAGILSTRRGAPAR